jgi:hypothetical protein
MLDGITISIGSLEDEIEAKGTFDHDFEYFYFENHASWNFIIVLKGCDPSDPFVHFLNEGGPAPKVLGQTPADTQHNLEALIEHFYKGF